jgi:hypothetical protein
MLVSVSFYNFIADYFEGAKPEVTKKRVYEMLDWWSRCAFSYFRVIADLYATDKSSQTDPSLPLQTASLQPLASHWLDNEKLQQRLLRRNGLCKFMPKPLLLPRRSHVSCILLFMPMISHYLYLLILPYDPYKLKVLIWSARSESPEARWALVKNVPNSASFGPARVNSTIARPRTCWLMALFAEPWRSV